MHTPHQIVTRRCSGFSLIELLVVISIVALLIALLLPALDNARFVARTLVCKTNQRQLVIAMNTYSADENNYYPIVDTTAFSVEPSLTIRTGVGITAWNNRTMRPLGSYVGYDEYDSQNMSSNATLSGRTNRMMQCPEAVAKNPELRDNYFGIFAVSLTGQYASKAYPSNIQKFNTGGPGTYTARDWGQVIMGPDDRMLWKPFNNNFGWDNPSGWTTLITSDWTMRSGVGGGESVVTNHIQGQRAQVSTSSQVAVDGVVTTNYGFTDGSVRGYTFGVNPFRDQMSFGRSEGGTSAALVPDEWLK